MISAVKSPLVNCRIHGKTHLNIDKDKFKVYCRACKDKGEHTKNLEICQLEEEEEFGDDEIECDNHPSSKGKFYCDDCRIFICKVCFANDHRSHNSNLLAEISVNFKKILKNSLN